MFRFNLENGRYPKEEYGYLIEQSQDRDGHFWELSIYDKVDGNISEEPKSCYQYDTMEQAKADIETANIHSHTYFDGI